MSYPFRRNTVKNIFRKERELGNPVKNDRRKVRNQQNAIGKNPFSLYRNMKLQDKALFFYEWISNYKLELWNQVSLFKPKKSDKYSYKIFRIHKIKKKTRLNFLPFHVT